MTSGISSSAPKRSRLRHTAVNGLNLAYREHGSGHPLLLVMGFSAAMDMWPPELIESLAQSRLVITLDNRGIGRSAPSPAPYRFEDMATDALGLLDALGVDQADLMGFSMGSDIALTMLRLAPGRFAKALLLAGGPGGDEEIYPTERVGLLLDKAGQSPMERAGTFFRLMFPDWWLREHRDLRGIIPRQSEPVSAEGVAAQREAARTRLGETPHLGRIAASVLLVSGSEDVLSPPVNSRFMAGRIPRCLHIDIQGAGHGLMYQSPDTFRKYAVDFLAP